MLGGVVRKLDNVGQDSGCRVIVLAGPGARARQFHLSGAWFGFCLSLSLLSLGGSLFVGRQARAWFHDGPTRLLGPSRAMAAPRAEEREVAAMPLVSRRLSPLSPGRNWMAPLLGEDPIRAWLDPSVSSAGAKPGSPEPKRRAPGPMRDVAHHALSLLDVNSQNALRVVPFMSGGIPDQEAFADLKHFLRCRRSGRERDIDSRLIALLVRLSRHFEGADVHIISAHRKADGVVTRRTSQHTRGTAADVRIPGHGIEAVSRAAYNLGATGIGVYPVSGFVHLDVRRTPYYWRDRGEGGVAMRMSP